jgi:DNA-binding HxlR family transcriptional regulator
MEPERDIRGTVTCDIWQALRKFSNKNITQIAVTLKSGPLTLGEIRDITGIPTNILSHNLIEMRNADLAKKIGPRYYLTVYGKELLEAIEVVLKKLHPIPNDMLFEPYASQEV